jgi:hypothetical protein
MDDREVREEARTTMKHKPDGKRKQGLKDLINEWQPISKSLSGLAGAEKQPKTGGKHVNTGNLNQTIKKCG